MGPGGRKALLIIACVLCVLPHARALNIHPNLDISAETGVSGEAHPGFGGSAASQKIPDQPDAGIDEDGEHELDTQVVEFFKWLRANGMPEMGTAKSAIRVKVAHRGGLHANGTRADISLSASRDLAKGETVLSIPRSLWITSATAGSEIMPYLTDFDSWTAYTVIAAWVLRERAKGDDSEWAPYVRLLPAHVPTPLFLDAESRKEYNYQPFIDEMERNKEGLRAEYERCDKEALAGASLAEFEWAVSVVRSRVFPDHSRAAGFLLAPLADFFNHDFRYQLRWQPPNDKTQAFELTAVANIKRGKPLHISYGPMWNEKFVLPYGFVPPGPNPYDAVHLFTAWEDVVALYLRAAAGADMDHDPANHEAKKARAVAIKAKNAVDDVGFVTGNQADRIPVPGPELDYSEKLSGFAVWPDAHVEPRLLAMLAAMWHVDNHHEELDYEELAAASIKYGRAEGNMSCGDPALGAAAAGGGLRFAAQLVYQKALDAFRAFPAPLSKDEEYLRSVAGCRELVSKERSLLGTPCSVRALQNSYTVETIARYRAGKKKILGALLSRLLATCDLGAKG